MIHSQSGGFESTMLQHSGTPQLLQIVPTANTRSLSPKFSLALAPSAGSSCLLSSLVPPPPSRVRFLPQLFSLHPSPSVCSLDPLKDSRLGEGASREEGKRLERRELLQATDQSLGCRVVPAGM